MKKSETIGIIVFIILVIILAISIWAGSRSELNNSATTKVKSPCELICRQTGTEEWVFRGQSFSSQEECVNQCKVTIK